MVDVPTMEQHLALQGQADDLTDEVLSLIKRVEALEAAAAPPAPEHPIPPEPPEQPIPPEPPPVVGALDLSACLVFGDGIQHWFYEADGTSLGSYRDPDGRFVQSCLEAICDDLPGVYLHFRRDAAGNRREVVFWAGEVFGLSTRVLGAYDATIFDATGEVVREHCPQHPWYTRWRWQEWQRPATRTFDELLERHYFPCAYDASMLKQYQADKGHQVYTIMGRAGLTGAMWQTGERPEIGPTTSHQADWIVAGSNYDSIIAQAEAINSFPICHRDETKSAPLDLIEYPQASWYAGNLQQDPKIVQPSYSIDGQKTGWDNGHEPSTSYLPFLLTGDPYYLEALQYQAHANLLLMPPKNRYSASGRYFAWPFRDMLQAWRCTDSNDMPRWLKGRDYFWRLLENYRAQCVAWINDPDPEYSVYHFFASGGAQSSAAYPAGSYGAPWQESFVTYELGVAVGMGLNEYREIFEWKARCDIMRTESDIWHVCNPAPYQFMFRAATTLGADIDAKQTVIVVQTPQNFWAMQAPFDITITSTGEVMRVIDGDEVKTTWTVQRAKPKAAKINAAIHGPYYPDASHGGDANFYAHPDQYPTMPGDPEGDNLLYVKKDPTYVSYLRGALELANQFGVSGADNALEFMHSQMTAAVSGSYKWDRKWCQRVE